MGLEDQKMRTLFIIKKKFIFFIKISPLLSLQPNIALILSLLLNGQLHYSVLMESWSYGSEGKGLIFSDEMDLDAFARSRKAMLSTDLEGVESMEFMDFGIASDMNKKPFYGNNSMGIFGAEFGNDSTKTLVSPSCMISSTSYFGEEDSGSKHCSSLMDSNSQESSLIDLKLGRLTDYKDAHHGKFLKETSVVSPVQPAFMPKKARKTNSHSLTPCCQVYGCNKDLSSSKDYHKRHKVCEAHSKTSKVIVKGVEQRFCQQCSRFHLLAEFDDEKHSCRKRLAGHNERRRKLNFNTFPGKSHKMLHSYHGTKFLGTSIPKRMPFVIPNIFHHPERHAYATQYQQVKSEEKPAYSSQSAIPITNGQWPPTSFFHMHGSGKQHVPGTFSSATEAFHAPSAASTVQDLSGMSHSDCALSLLSAQSQDLLSHATGLSMARPLINQAGYVHRSSEKSTFNSSFGKANNNFHSSDMNPIGVSQAGSDVVSASCSTGNFEVQVQDSDLLSARYCIPPENATTVDLLQLSTHLQRVEQQRNSMQVKQENEDMFYFLST